MAAAVAAPAIAPAEGLPLSDASVDDELVKVDFGAHVEHRPREAAAFSDDGDSENTTPCLVTVTSELFGTVRVTPESAFLAGEGEGGGEVEREDEEDEEYASGHSTVLVGIRAVEVVVGIWLQKIQGEQDQSSQSFSDSAVLFQNSQTLAEDLVEPWKNNPTFREIE
ncbi:hypothetical protein E4U33_006238 [Claviceps sp. LM78 group G4]|nr:hypothetical protein E4U33_006238 [Claviceps sp. LM78 group G4]